MEFSPKVQSFLSVIQLGVVSTIGPGQMPQSAVVGITTILNMNEIMIGTSRKSRKYRNMQQNPSVSLVMWHDKVTVQCEGKAEIIEPDNPLYSKYLKKILDLHPGKIKYTKDPEQVWIIFRPNWLCYTDTSAKPWIIEEQRV